jgi:hypothetical protein
MNKVHHLVVVKFKPDTSPATIANLFTALARLQQVIPGIEHYAGGPYASHEGLNQGFTHGFLMTFSGPAARNTYLTHPEHEQLKRDFLPSIENVIAFDFEEPARGH